MPVKNLSVVSTGLFCLAVYILTLCPTIPGGDSGEFVTIAVVRAVAHPPGYPIYTLLAKLFTIIPLGSIAMRVNFLSAVCSALMAVFLFLGVARWTGSNWAGFFATGLAAFSPLIWRYSVVAEVFPLNNLFIAVLCYLAIRYRQDKEQWIPFLGAFIFGLGLSNHHTLIFYGIPLTIWILSIGGGNLWKWRYILVLTTLFVIGFLPYLYFPYAGSFQNMSSWGDFSTWEGFLHHFLRKDFGTFSLGHPDMYGKKELVGQIGAYARSLPGEVLYVGIPLAILGLIAALRTEKLSGFALISFTAYAFYLIVFHTLSNLPLDQPLYLDIHSRFWQQANLFVCMWAGYGISLFHTVPALPGSNPAALRKAMWAPWKKKTAPSSISRGLASYGLPALVLGLVAAQLLTHWQREDQNKNWIIHRWGTAVLTALPNNALVLTKGDLWVNTIRYLQQVEGVRHDVCLLDLELLKTTWMKASVEAHYPDIVIPGTVYREEDNYREGSQHYRLQGLIEANINNRPVFVNRFKKLTEFEWPDPYVSQPVGFLIRVLPGTTPFDIDAFITTSEATFQGFVPESSGVHIRTGSWESTIRDSYITSRDAYAGMIVTYANAHGNEPSLLRRAEQILEELIRVQPKPLYYKNLGIVYLRLGRTDPSLTEKMVRAWTTYLTMAPEDDPDVPDIIRELDAVTGRVR